MSVSSFLGRVPYVQQLNYYGAASAAPSVQGFVFGARQAEVANVGAAHQVDHQLGNVARVVADALQRT